MMTHYCNSSYSENEFSLVNNLPEREDEWAWGGGGRMVWMAC